MNKRQYIETMKHPNHDYLGCEMCGSKMTSIVQIGANDRDIESIIGVCDKHIDVVDLSYWRQTHLKNLRNRGVDYNPKYYGNQ